VEAAAGLLDDPREGVGGLARGLERVLGLRREEDDLVDLGGIHGLEDGGGVADAFRHVDVAIVDGFHGRLVVRPSPSFSRRRIRRRSIIAAVCGRG
jgi:hypothetical protein